MGTTTSTLLMPAELLDQLPRAGAQALGVHPLFERAPQGQRQEAHQNVRLDAVLFVMKHRAQAEIAFGGPKRGLRLRELDVPAP